MNDDEVLKELFQFRDELHEKGMGDEYSPEQIQATASRLRKILRSWDTDNDLIKQFIQESAEESREIEVYTNWRTISELESMLNDFIALAQRNIPET